MQRSHHKPPHLFCGLNDDWDPSSRLPNKCSGIIALKMDYLPAPPQLLWITNSHGSPIPYSRVTNLRPRLSILAPDLFLPVPQKTTLNSRFSLPSRRNELFLIVFSLAWAGEGLCSLHTWRSPLRPQGLPLQALSSFIFLLSSGFSARLPSSIPRPPGRI